MKPEPLMIECRELPDFNAGSLDDVRQAFLGTTPCFLRQAWLKKEEADFKSAVVKTGWRHASLLVFAELIDSDIFSRATRFKQRLWELGDTFEIFLRPVEQEAYVEFQVSPGNQRLPLRYPDAAALRSAWDNGTFESAVVHDKAFHSNTWVRSQEGRWFVFAEIPAESVRSKARPLSGDEWRFSFSRYDYTRGRKEPVISSTSPHTKANFHRQQEWGTISFRSQILPPIQGDCDFWVNTL
jgi:hypothetical protein